MFGVSPRATDETNPGQGVHRLGDLQTKRATDERRWTREDSIFSTTRQLP